MLNISKIWPAVQSFQRLGALIGSALSQLQQHISESSADNARRRLGAYVALKAGRLPPTFDVGARVNYSQNHVIVHADGRVLDQTRHGVLVEFPKISPMLVAPESLSVVGKSYTQRRITSPARKPRLANQFRRKLI